MEVDKIDEKGVAQTGLLIAVVVIVAIVASGIAYVVTRQKAAPGVSQSPWIGSGKLDGNGIPPDFFSDIDVRLGFAYAFDYDTFIQDAYLGEAKQPASIIVEGLPYINPAQEKYTFDLGLAENHFKKAFGGAVWENGFNITILYNTGNEARRIAAQILQKNITGLNPKFKIAVANRDWNTYLHEIVLGRLPTFIVGWQVDFPDPHDFVFPFMDSRGTYAQWQGYSNPTVDNLISEGIRATNPDTRREIYYELQQIYYNDVPSVATDQPTGRHYQRDWVQGWYFNPIIPGTPEMGYVYTVSKNSNANNPDTLTYASIGEPESLDPAWAYDTASGEAIVNVYETLIFFKGENTNEFDPVLAENWVISPDGLTYTFKIRSGIHFQNGDSLTPEDVEYSFERAMAQDRDGGPAWMLLEPLLGLDSTRDANGTIVVPFEDIDRAVEIENNNVVFHLKQAYPPFMQILAQTWSSIVDKQWCIDHGDWPGTAETYENYNNPSPKSSIQDKMNGTGPFELSSWEQGVQYILARNDNYWRTPAKLKNVIVKRVDEWTDRKLSFLAGDTDFLYVPRANINELENVAGINYMKDLPTLVVDCMFFNENIK
jgi:ABC-type transport system substrate-binding protein